MPSVGEHGTGTITTRADGRIQIAATLVNGRRIYRYVPAAEARRDPKTAARRARKILAELLEIREAELDPSGQTLAVWLRSWLTGLRDAKRARVRPRTLEHYAMIAERHIIPTLGAIRIDRLSERAVQAWLDADGGSPRTIHHHRAVLRRALNVALRQRVIARNPAINVELPDPSGFTPSPLTLEEARRLLTVTANDRLGVLWRLAIDTGLREGELLGLGWDDVDLDAAIVTVRAQLQRIAGAWVRTPPKVGRSLEVLSLTPATVAALRSHRARQAGERTPAWRYWGHVFLTSNGEPYHDAEILKAFKAACRRAAIEPRRFHDLRSTADTLMAEAGVAEHVRMARLGHLTKEMARHYTAVREVLDRDAAERLERVLGA